MAPDLECLWLTSSHNMAPASDLHGLDHEVHHDPEFKSIAAVSKQVSSAISTFAMSRSRLQ